MSQEECLRILESEDRWMTAREISEIAESQIGATSRGLRTLVMHNEIYKKFVKIGNYNRNVYRYYKE